VIDAVPRPGVRAPCSCSVGVMYDRVHSREISALWRGHQYHSRSSQTFMVLFALANSGLPGTSGFVGEFMVILASFKANVWYADPGRHHPGFWALPTLCGWSNASIYGDGSPTTRWRRSRISTAASSWMLGALAVAVPAGRAMARASARCDAGRPLCMLAQQLLVSKIAP